MYESTTYTSSQPLQPKQRHLCLTAYLALMIIANIYTISIYQVGFKAITQEMTSNSGLVFPILIILGIFNIVCAIALFYWKKWGFWGLVNSAAIAFLIGLFAGGLGFSSSLVGLLGIAFLYGVLHIGSERKGWSQLE